MTSAAGSASSPDRRSAEPQLVANAVVIKEEPIEEDNDEEVATYSLKISPEEAAQVKLEEVMFDWPSN